MPLIGFVYGSFGVCLGVLDPTAPANVPLQYGALGLLGLMIWMQSGERKHMIETIENNEKDFRQMLKDQLVLNQQFLDAAKAMLKAAETCSSRSAKEA
jgi:hypothetical protein